MLTLLALVNDCAAGPIPVGPPQILEEVVVVDLKTIQISDQQSVSHFSVTGLNGSVFEVSLSLQTLNQSVRVLPTGGIGVVSTTNDSAGVGVSSVMEISFRTTTASESQIKTRADTPPDAAGFEYGPVDLVLLDLDMEVDLNASSLPTIQLTTSRHDSIWNETSAHIAVNGTSGHTIIPTQLQRPSASILIKSNGSDFALLGFRALARFELTPVSGTMFANFSIGVLVGSFIGYCVAGFVALAIVTLCALFVHKKCTRRDQT